MARVLDGAGIAASIKNEVAEEVKALSALGIRPGLAAVLVGHVEYIPLIAGLGGTVWRPGLTPGIPHRARRPGAGGIGAGGGCADQRD